ncbi:MAG: DNA polymerase III subunit alpha [Bacteroidales bacterium]|nr:DNA polymerase III subunit alpha [Bacteroidales bacterium]
MFLIFDTETTGLPRNYNAPVSNSENWPRMVQLAWQLHDEKGELFEAGNYIIQPEGFTIPYNASKVHGITDEKAQQEGVDLNFVLDKFNDALTKTQFIVGHNISFDVSILGAEYYRKSIQTNLLETPAVDTMDESTDYLKLAGGKGGGFKKPNLTELHKNLFDESFDEAHNATADVEATARCFLELVRLQVISPETIKFTSSQFRAFLEHNPGIIQPAGVDIKPRREAGKKPSGRPETEEADESQIHQVSDIPFCHLHVHTQYSILDGAAPIKNLVRKASRDGMQALAITDHGNMFGAKDFHQYVNGHNASIEKALTVDPDKERKAIEALKENLKNENRKEKRDELKEAIKEAEENLEETLFLKECTPLKPIIGCEVYVARRSMHQKEDKIDGSGDHLVLLAKNQTGYENLVKLISYGWLEGFYYHPRVDKELIRQYSEGLIAMSACLGGEVAQTIMNRGEEKAREVIKEYKDLFGEDFYLELQLHPTDDEKTREVYDDQKFVNGVLRKLSREMDVKLVASNDVHFVNEEDAPAHDRLICISTNKDVDDPDRLRYTKQEFLKTQDEMRKLFADTPEALENTKEVASKVEEYSLYRKPIMPEFTLPEGFTDHNEYLQHITYEGAKKRYGEINESLKERIDFELETIKSMGFPSYFLIVWDFLKAARELDVSVGPGRGSAAGSVVAYSLRITEIDPLPYDLLFERFLNPERISMPDIDIDFDDDGREKILDWVVKKYGNKRVAHIITFGTMAAKLAIRDVARVQRLPLPEADRLAKMVPEKPGMSLKKAYEENPDLQNELDNGQPEVSSVLKYAQTLEGTVRNIGTHACGIIIGRDDLENYVPISTAKDSELQYVTQYDGKFVESIGLLKMDFLGLKTLSIIKEAVENVKLSKGIDVDIEHVTLDDANTYKLYSKGETSGLFQFESDGMKKHLKELKPSRFEDLIAMNALYRPGPMDYIPSFIKRKYGKEKIEYDLPEMEEYLEETYGITVYQEQVMRLSRKLANFTRGQSDTLRKAMSKKDKNLMAKLKVEFSEGCKKNGHPPEKIEKIWNDWESFASYAFNKSHATCYSYVSYQTAYLKANYPAEFMAAVLSRNMNSIEKVTFFTEECNRMGIKVLGPDINESHARFTVNQNGEIRFGMVAVKGVGEGVVEAIVEERSKNGPFLSVFDLVKRIDLRSVNRKALESLAMAGAFDNLSNSHRAQYFYQEHEGDSIFLEKLLKYAASYQNQKASAQQSLFGDSEEVAFPNVTLPQCEQWSTLQLLKAEKEVTGFYISGHPLDEYRIVLKNFTNADINKLNSNRSKFLNREIHFGGIISEVVHTKTKYGQPMGFFTVEDFSGSIKLILFKESYLKMKHMLVEETPVYVKARVVSSKRNEGELDVRVSSILLLSDVMDQMTREITLNLQLNDVDEELINELHTLTETHSGNCPLNFSISDPGNGKPLAMPSTLKVNCFEFVNAIEKMNKVHYRLKTAT